MTFNLSKLAPTPGSRKKRKTVGRGEGSGHGKTSCRGGKGQTARSGGGIRAGFEGGQMPIYRRISKLGFKSRKRAYGINEFLVVNLSTLNGFKDGAEVSSESLAAMGYVRTEGTRGGVKILGRGDLSVKNLKVKVNAISESAKRAIEAKGGSIELVARAKTVAAS